MFELGQCATPTRAAPRRRISSGFGMTQWATQLRSVHQPTRSKYSTGRQPNVAREYSSSSAFSARWVCRRTSSRSASSALRSISVGRHAERRARRECDARHRAVGAVVVPVHLRLALGEDLVVVLHHVVRWQPAVLLGQRHRTAGRMEAQAEVAGGGDLRRQQVAATAGMEVEVVARRGAAGQCELGESDPRRHVRRLLVECPPPRVERLQPTEQGRRRHRRERPGQVLEQVVVGVDEAGRHQAAVGAQLSDADGGRVGGGADRRHESVRHRHPSAAQLAALAVHRRHEVGARDDEVGDRSVRRPDGRRRHRPSIAAHSGPEKASIIARTSPSG